MRDSVVKIDKELLEKIENLVKEEKYRYSSKKQVVNLAIIEFLNKHSLNKNTRKQNKKRVR